ncbi:sulfite reductase [Aureococcus anophagefferens]|nr:sulfite reductase [Aureococcus anophagefferens]
MLPLALPLALKTNAGAGMTDSLGSLVENLRPHPSSLRKQVEARHKSAGEFSFYGPAGSDFGQSLCKPRTRDAGHFSPGPARYNYLHMTPELVTRLNQHRAKQQDWPSSANFNTSDIQSKFTFEQYPRCNFGQSTAAPRPPPGAPGDRARRSRPFFDPLPNSCQSTIRERLRRHNPNQP